MVVLNSQLDSGTAQQAQEDWLKKDLAANRGTTCTLAYWHHPHYSSGHNAIVAGESQVSVELYEPAAVKRYFQLLYDKGAEIVLSGHKHNYERFAPQDANGNLRDENGVRQFVVGTGGRSTGGFDQIRRIARCQREHLRHPRPDVAVGRLRLDFRACGGEDLY